MLHVTQYDTAKAQALHVFATEFRIKPLLHWVHNDPLVELYVKQLSTFPVGTVCTHDPFYRAYPLLQLAHWLEPFVLHVAQLLTAELQD